MAASWGAVRVVSSSRATSSAVGRSCSNQAAQPIDAATSPSATICAGVTTGTRLRRELVRWGSMHVLSRRMEGRSLRRSPQRSPANRQAERYGAASFGAFHRRKRSPDGGGQTENVIEQGIGRFPRVGG